MSEAKEEPRLVQCVPWLNGCASNVYTQYGEDGLIAAILEKIGTTNRWCFEVGASDGVTLSNVALLIGSGWHAAMIEADRDRFRLLAKRYDGNTHVKAICERVFPWTFEAVLAKAGVPEDPDVGVIDIDEQDFWLWAGMQRCRPRIMIVEFGLGRPVDQIPPLSNENREPIRIIQAGRNMVHYLGVSKGYCPLAVTECNIIWCRGDCLES
jgi:hypothetical protein